MIRLALLVVIVTTISCGGGGGGVMTCGAGLAAVDLAGNCRAQLNPTPGALEAVN